MGKNLGGNQVYWFIAIVALAVFGAVGLKMYRSQSGGADISRSELKAWMDEAKDVCILDVRSANEYQSGHIPGAINIDYQDISNRLDELAPYKNRKIVVYCRSGRRSRIAQKALNEAGFTEVYHLAGDMIGWNKAGLPTDTNSPE